MARKLCIDCVQVFDTQRDTCPVCNQVLRDLDVIQTDKQHPHRASDNRNVINDVAQSQEEPSTHIIDEQILAKEHQMADPTQSTTYVCSACGSMWHSPSIAKCPSCGSASSTRTSQQILTSKSPASSNVTGITSSYLWSSRASEVRDNAYPAAEIMVRILSIVGGLFLLSTILLVFSICVFSLGILGGGGEGWGYRILGLTGFSLTVPTMLAVAFITLVCFYLRDMLRMKIDDTRNIVFMAKRYDEMVQAQTKIALLLQQRDGE